MKRPTAIKRKSAGTKKSVIGARAFDAITSVEGLELSVASKRRLKHLEGDLSLTPSQRRDAVVRAYAAMSRKK